MKLREQYARKRGGGEFDLVLDELKDTIASGDSVEAECERKEFAAAVNQFLCTLSADDRNIFCVPLLVLCFHSGHCIEVQVFTKQSKNLAFPNQAEITAIFI